MTVAEKALDWTPLQADVCMTVALAKRAEFIHQAIKLGEWVRLGFLPVAEAADALQEAAIYNALTIEYGTDHIQQIMSRALQIETAA